MNEEMSFADRIKYRVVLALLTTIAYLPFCVLYFISDLAKPFVQYVIKYRRKVVRENLKKVFSQEDASFRRKVEDKFYSHLCDNIFETIKILHISDSELDRRITISGVEVLKAILDKHTPIMAMLGHYGNWEWVQELSNRLGPEYKVGEIYRPVRDSVSNRIMFKIRSRWNTELIPQKAAVRHILGMSREDGRFVIGFIADQRPNGVVLDNWCEFLGQNTAYVNGAEMIGRKIGAVFAYLDMQKKSRGHYRLECRLLDIGGMQSEQFPYTVKYLQELEKTILNRPELWLWSHKRWTIPSYCRTSSTSEKK